MVDNGKNDDGKDDDDTDYDGADDDGTDDDGTDDDGTDDDGTDDNGTDGMVWMMEWMLVRMTMVWMMMVAWKVMVWMMMSCLEGHNLSERNVVQTHQKAPWIDILKFWTGYLNRSTNQPTLLQR